MSTQECAALLLHPSDEDLSLGAPVLGYSRFVPTGRAVDGASERTADPSTPLRSAPYEHGPFHRAPTGREADFGACTQDSASLVLGYYPSAPPGRFFTVRNVHFRRNPPTRVKLLLTNGVLEGCGFPLIRKKHANEWGTVHLRFIQGVTRNASQSAQDDSVLSSLLLRVNLCRAHSQRADPCNHSHPLSYADRATGIEKIK